MDAAALFFMLVVLLALIGVLIYVIQDYYKYKDATDTALHSNKNLVITERDDRLSNIKYVADQLNTIHDDIYSQFSSNVSAQSTSLGGVKTRQDSLISGLDQYIRYSSNQPLSAAAGAAGAGAGFKITDFPGTAPTDVSLMAHTTFLGGLKATDLTGVNAVSTTGQYAQFCGTASTSGGAAKCIQFPNSTGNTYLTTLVDGTQIQLDAPTAVSGVMYIKNSATATSGPSLHSLAEEISSGNRTLNINAKNVGVSENPNLIPTAKLEVLGAGAEPLLRVRPTNASYGDAIRVDASGDVIIPKIRVRTTGSTNAAEGGVIEATATGLKISAAEVVVEGGPLTVSELKYRKLTAI